MASEGANETLSFPFMNAADIAAPSVRADQVFRPHHYARFVIEPLTFVNANKLSFNAGNAIKYICRHDAKNGLEDLRKARRYIDIMIECAAREQRVKDGESPGDVWKEVL